MVDPWVEMQENQCVSWLLPSGVFAEVTGQLRCIGAKSTKPIRMKA